MKNSEINKRPKMENIIVISPDEQKEINKSVIKIICEILFENDDINYEERNSLIRNASK